VHLLKCTVLLSAALHEEPCGLSEEALVEVAATCGNNAEIAADFRGQLCASTRDREQRECVAAPTQVPPHSLGYIRTHGGTRIAEREQEHLLDLSFVRGSENQRFKQFRVAFGKTRCRIEHNR
jgi:hypothetical protein